MKDQNLEQLPEQGFLRQSQIIPSIVPISSPTLWRWIKLKKFPAPVKLGPRMVGWRVSDVSRWIESRKAA